MNKRVVLNELYDATVLIHPLPEDNVELICSIQGYQYVVLYTLTEVKIMAASGFASLPGDLLELRAFDSSGELHVVNVEGRLVGRVCVDCEDDESGEPCLALDEEHLLWGNPVNPGADKQLMLQDDRGTSIALPIAAKSVGADALVTILVRNYAQASEVTGDFNFSDYRFVDFVVKGCDVDE